MRPRPPLRLPLVATLLFSCVLCVLTLTACSVPAVTPPLTAAQIVDRAQHAPLKSAAFSGPMTVSLDGIVVSGRVTGQETIGPDRRIAAVTATRGALSLTYTQLDAGSKTYAKSPPLDSWSTQPRAGPAYSKLTQSMSTWLSSSSVTTRS